jgi:nucleoside phosphorylase/tetratricopeptide (TPR) repeat protein
MRSKLVEPMITEPTTAQHVDIGIVVALPEELRTFLDLSESYTPHPDDDLDAYLFTRGPYRCAVILVGEMGQTHAGMFTERLISALDPTILVSIGIAGGVHDDLHVGDVHVPSQAVEYIQDAKALPAQGGGFAIVPGAPAYRADYALLKAVRSFEFTHRAQHEAWVVECGADLAALLPDAAQRESLVTGKVARSKAKLLAGGHVATGPVVGAAPAFSAWIRSHDRNVKSLEMESAAVLAVAQTRSQQKRALALRGISDKGDADKKKLDDLEDGVLRKYAMRNAVRLLWALLDAEALPLEARSSSTTPTAPPAPDVNISRLPATGRELFGRETELAWLTTCWDEGVRVVSIVASGGMGKSSLVNAWLRSMDGARWRGATRVYGWSFYSQGTDRLASSDEFFSHALRRFGDTEAAPTSPWEKGERLAALVRKRRALLILDGVEPLQWGPGQQEGKLKDPALLALMKELGAQNMGLCVVTSRLALTDMEGVGGDRVDARTLAQLSPEAGAELLRARGVKGPDEDLREAAEEYRGHGLALTLLGSYLADVAGGDIRRRKEIGPLEDDERLGRHAQRVMTAYEKWLGKPEVAILHMLGLFDRPAEEDEIAALRAEPVVPGLTNALVGVGMREWQKAVAKLQRVGLLEEQDKGIDAHPLVREHFGEQVKREQPDAWREGHRRLYEHLKNKAKPLPETIEEMAPLCAAVVHGCMAGQHQEVLEAVFWDRIYRRDDKFNWKKLGALSSEAAILSAFFDPPWERLAPGLSERNQGLVLNNAGFALSALGRLPEAAGLMRMALEQTLTREDWANAGISASNLSNILQARGELREALALAQESVEFADKSGHDGFRMSNRTTLATVQHAMGLQEEATAQFEEAERIQKKRESDYPRVYALSGLRYGELLLDQGRDADVRERAAHMLASIPSWYSLFDIAVDHLSLGRVHLLAAQRGYRDDLAEAASHLKQAVDGLRRYGDESYLPLGLLARAALHTHTHAFDLARRDLDEVLTLAERCGFRLHEADAHLGFARLSLAEGDLVAAREHLDRARTIVAATGYHRRDRELAELDAACPAPLQAVDLLVILKLAALGSPSEPVRLVAEELGLSVDAVTLSLRRLEAMRLLRDEGGHRRINKLALRWCLEQAVRWIAPAEVGGAELGLLTAHSAPALASRLIGDDGPVVMPLPGGPARGRAVTPLHPLAPGAAARDPKLYALLALVDALRIGRAREREVAAVELRACL